MNPEYGDDPINPLNVGQYHQCPGLTKREYFAGLAMQGMLAAGNPPYSDTLAEVAVIYAEELLEELC